MNELAISVYSAATPVPVAVTPTKRTGSSRARRGERVTRHATPRRRRTAEASLPGAAAATKILLNDERLSDTLPHLHQQVIRALGASRSLLTQPVGDGSEWQVLSATGLDDTEVGGTWRPRQREARAIAGIFKQGSPTYVATPRSGFPVLTTVVGAGRVLLVPVSPGSRALVLLAVGVSRRPARARVNGLAPITQAIGLVLARARLAGEVELHASIRRLLAAYSDAVSPALYLNAGLDAMCSFADDIFGSSRTSVWLHDRRKQQLVLAASSDPTVERDVRVPTADPTAPAAQGLRGPAPEIRPGRAVGGHPGSRLVLVPLKGYRRALGTVVLEGVGRVGWTRADVLAHAREFGQQLSGAVENVQLLQDVIQSRRELENTFNSIADLVAVCDRQLCLARANQAFATRVGLGRDALLDRPLGDLVGPDIRAWMGELDLDAARGASIAGPRETHDPQLGGTFSVTLTRLMNQANEPVGLVLVARDVTERTRLEAERAELSERLAQSEKLAALGQFVAGIAHELNNPLQAVLGHVELLSTATTLPRDVARDFKTVTREAERAAKIVRNLLVFAGYRKLVKSQLSLNAVVKRALALRAETCQAAEIEVVHDLDQARPRLAGDALLLQQALLNILINAEHAVARSATRRIEVRTRYDPRRKAASIRIRDSGHGIAAEVMLRLFEPFFTTKEVGQGTGLGLAITHGIVQEHAGQVTAANDPNGGAVFTVQLPARPSRQRDKTGRNSLK